MDPRPHLWILIAKQRLLDQHTSLYVYQISPGALCMQNSVRSIRIPTSGFCIKKSDFWTSIIHLYWSQRSPVVLCMQYIVISNRIICLYRSQPWSVVFEGKTATFGPDIQVCMGPRPHLSLCARKTSWVAPELQVSVGPRSHLALCACKTACVASESLVSMGPSPHLWFLDA